MGTPSEVVTAVLLVLLLLHGGRLTMATWCVARSEASTEALQTALDYACSAGADCVPLQQQPVSGLCFLPNTIQAHASYAFNSYYMRKFMAPGSCDFSGTATVAKTDPSYGSCVYPSSPSTAGATTPITTPVSGGTPTPQLGGGLTPVGSNGILPPTPPSDSKASRTSNTIVTAFFVFLLFQLIQIMSTHTLL